MTTPTTTIGKTITEAEICTSLPLVEHFGGGQRGSGGQIITP